MSALPTPEAIPRYVLRVRVGIQLPEVEREVRWPEYAAMARAVEESGFDSVWVGDHLLYRGDGRPERGPWDAWTLLAGLATVTERVQIGPLVACTAFHAPGILARTAAAVDELSGGRLVVALGSGWNETEFRAFGIPFERRAARFLEAFEIVRRLLAGERVTVHGEFHHVEDALLLPPPARTPPLMVGTTGPRLLAATLPHVDAWNCWWEQYGNTPEGFAELNARIDEAAGARAAEIDRSCCVLVAVDGGAGERRESPAAPPVDAARIGPHLRELADAGADEAILVLDPITEASIRRVAEAR
jgi:alkanesulfonate monooxygenase SsuD/methylene tetrahydromethanopterin reductase-like flavin-dependent oxidoreductase (luciferase family)